ncbi:hypothetical protein WDW89_01585 [Deltaproteobacteria bacterium TL4]
MAVEKRIHPIAFLLLLFLLLIGCDQQSSNNKAEEESFHNADVQISETIQPYLDSLEGSENRQRIEQDLNSFNGFLVENGITTLKGLNDAFANPNFENSIQNFLATHSSLQDSSQQRSSRFLGSLWESIKGWLNYLTQVFENFIENILKFLQGDHTGDVPTHPAEGLTFTDTDSDKGEIAGDIIIKKASDESDITDYVIYWGSDETTKLTDQSAIATIVKTGDDLSYTIVADTAILHSATHLLVFTTNANGEMDTGISVKLIDIKEAVPTHAASSVVFADTDIDEGEIAGEIIITKASDESDITHYVLYWGSDANTKLENELAITTIEKTGSNYSGIICTDFTGLFLKQFSKTGCFKQKIRGPHFISH